MVLTASTSSRNSTPGFNKNILGFLPSIISTSAFCTWTVSPPGARDSAWLTWLFIFIFNVKLPWVTAEAVTLTFRLITTVPERELTTTRAGGSPGVTSKDWTIAMKLTRSELLSGAKIRNETESKASAVSTPKFSLIALTIREVVVKSCCLRFITI